MASFSAASACCCLASVTYSCRFSKVKKHEDWGQAYLWLSQAAVLRVTQAEHNFASLGTGAEP